MLQSFPCSSPGAALGSVRRLNGQGGVQTTWLRWPMAPRWLSPLPDNLCAPCLCLCSWRDPCLIYQPPPPRLFSKTSQQHATLRPPASSQRVKTGLLLTCCKVVNSSHPQSRPPTPHPLIKTLLGQFWLMCLFFFFFLEFFFYFNMSWFFYLNDFALCCPWTGFSRSAKFHQRCVLFHVMNHFIMISLSSWKIAYKCNFVKFAVKWKLVRSILILLLSFLHGQLGI